VVVEELHHLAGLTGAWQCAASGCSVGEDVAEAANTRVVLEQCQGRSVASAARG
jgi:hypothetical protein